MTSRRKPTLIQVSSLLLIAIISTLTGCRGEEVPVSPNEKTAAPARLPGENPKSQNDQSLNTQGRGK